MTTARVVKALGNLGFLKAPVAPPLLSNFRYELIVIYIALKFDGGKTSRISHDQ